MCTIGSAFVRMAGRQAPEDREYVGAASAQKTDPRLT
jgi:hypothetical protein